MNRFAGKVIAVTGGNRGIGFAIAARFAQEGASVAIASIEEHVHEAAEALVASTGATVLPVVCDVAKASDVKELYSTIEKQLGCIDVSIQNAGIITIAKVENLTEAEWDDTMEVNTKGVFLCCQQAIAHIRKSGKGGRLINTASGQARDGDSKPCQGSRYRQHYGELDLPGNHFHRHVGLQR